MIRGNAERLRAARPKARPQTLRAYWITAIVLAIMAWPFIGLTYWHLTFFIALGSGLYLSFSRLILPIAVYLSFMLLYWVAVPILQQSAGVGYYIYRSDLPEFGPVALAFVLVHLAGIYVGFNTRKITVSRKSFTERPFSFLGILVIMALIPGLTAIVGIETILYPRTEQETQKFSNYAIFLRNFVKLIPAFLLAYLTLQGGKTAKSRDARLVVGLMVALCLVIVSNPVNTSRFLSLFGIFVVVLVYAIKYSKLNILAWTLAIMPFYAITLLSITSAMRSGLGNIKASNSASALQSLEFSSFSIFLDSLNVVSLPNGNYLISHLFVIIPRDLWLAKAESLGIDVAARSGYVYNNVGVNSFVNSYSDYGFVGLFIFSAFFGCLAKNFNPVFLQASFYNRRFMYGILFTGMMPMFFRGDLSTAMLAFYPALLLYEIVRFATNPWSKLGIR